MGSVFGAVCALVIVLPPMSFLLNWCLKLLISFIIVFITFGCRTLSVFIKNTVIFYFISFCFCGLMLFVWFIFTPRGLYIKNAVVYFNISPTVMIITTLICYFVIRLMTVFIAKSDYQSELCKVKIIHNGQSCEFYGKTDTGNTLYEPFSNFPVIVVNENAVCSVVQEEFQKFLQDEYDIITENKKYRLIPFQSVSGRGLLPAFLPDAVYINNTQCQQKIYIAVCKNNIGNGSIQAMINPEIVRLVKEGIHNDICKNIQHYFHH